jgi:hypothetical protein
MIGASDSFLAPLMLSGRYQHPRDSIPLRLSAAAAEVAFMLSMPRR